MLKDHIVRRMTTRFHAAVDLMARLANGSVEGRIAAILFILSESYGEKIDGAIRLKVPLTRQEIAEMAGTTGESAIRVMSRWQKEGLVETDRGTISICDEKTLRHLLV